jgi:hypothetical protein
MRGWLVGVAFGMALCAAGAADAQSVNIAGTWNVQGAIQVGGTLFSAAPTCKFEQVGDRLAGTCIGPNAAGPLTGVVSGRAVSWTWTHRATDAVGNSGVTDFDGVYVDRHLIRGTMTSSGVPARGTFTQTR